MNYIIFQKTMNDLRSLKDGYEDIRSIYPGDTIATVSEKAYKSLAEAKKQNPGKIVMTVLDFKKHKAGLKKQFKHLDDAMKARLQEKLIAEKLEEPSK